MVVEAANQGIDRIYVRINYSLELAQNVEQLYAQGSVGQVLTGNGLNNTIVGAGFADALSGGAGNDTLSGAAGDDVLTGGAGVDSMAGGLGIDTFVFNAASESTATLRDVIVDFTSVTDRIDLRGIDASSLIGGDQAFAFATAAAAHSVWAVTSTTNMLLRGDVTGDLLADFEVFLTGATRVLATDLFL